MVTLTRGNTTISVEALPLPQSVTDLIDSHDNLLQALDHHISQSIGGRMAKYDRKTTLNEQSVEKLDLLRQQLQKLLVASDNDEWKTLASNIWSFGPRKYGPNLLVNGVSEYQRPSVWDMAGRVSDPTRILREFDSSIINGFQLASLTGPMCGEPLRGVAFVIRKWEVLYTPPINLTGRVSCCCASWCPADTGRKFIVVKPARLINFRI